MTKLEPCPFCGMNVAEPTSLLECELCANFEDDELCPNYESCGSDGCGHLVACNVNKGGCGASTGWYQTIEEAITAWNRRKPKKGTWEVKIRHHPYPDGREYKKFRCSVCGNDVDDHEDTDFCPWCGADMRENQNT